MSEREDMFACLSLLLAIMLAIALWGVGFVGIVWFILVGLSFGAKLSIVLKKVGPTDD